MTLYNCLVYITSRLTNPRRLWLPGCEYGDRDVTYCSQILRRDCYDASIQQTCCARCTAERNVNASANCQFGDKANWCNPSQFTSHGCYSSADTCCESCAAYHTGLQGMSSNHFTYLWTIDTLRATKCCITIICWSIGDRVSTQLKFI